MTNRGKVACALAVAAVAWLFAGPLFAGRVLYYRDVSVFYYPDLVFVARCLAGGVWPLWHPQADAGAPFVMAYPVHLLLLFFLGARATLAISPPLHILVAMVGASALARRLGASPVGAAVAGGVFGLSGFMLGAVLFPVFLGAAWAPLVVERFLALAAGPSPRRVASLALVLAVQAATLGAEAVVAAAIFSLALAPRLPGRRAALATGGSLLLAAALAAPLLFGTAATLRGSARGRGFAPEVGLSYSTPPPVLLEAALPRFFGDTHTFSDVGYWGQPFYPNGSPYFLSLYLGPVVLLLAARAGWRGRARLWGLAVLGILISLGVDGPLGPLLAHLLGPMRGVVKFSLLTALAVALLAGFGVEPKRGPGVRRPWLYLVPGLLLLALALAAATVPSVLSAALAPLIPAAAGPLARHVIAVGWPLDLGVTGAVTLAAGLALGRGERLLALAGLLALLDLLRVNGELNPSAEGAFYEPADAGGAGGRGRAFGGPVPLVLLRRRPFAAPPLERGRRLSQLGRLALLPRPPGPDAAHAGARRPGRRVRPRPPGPRAGGLDTRGHRGQLDALPPAPRPAAAREREVGVLVRASSGQSRVVAGRGPLRRGAGAAAPLRAAGPAAPGLLRPAARTRLPGPGGGRERRAGRGSPTRGSIPTPSFSGPRLPRGSSWSWTVTTRTGRPRIGRVAFRFEPRSVGTRPSRPLEGKLS